MDGLRPQCCSRQLSGGAACLRVPGAEGQADAGLGAHSLGGAQPAPAKQVGPRTARALSLSPSLTRARVKTRLTSGTCPAIALILYSYCRTH
eukprot:SAG11_NODE_9328_length_921_cov_1.885645_1_plen_91_part_01